MKKDTVRKIIGDDLEKMGQYCHTIDKKFDAESIHEFRVQSKKIRALLRLLALQTGNADIRLTRRVKELYRLAGVMRDYQLMLQDAGDDIPELAKWLRHNIGAAQHKWQDNYKDKVLSRFADKTYELAESIDAGTVEKFFRQRCKTIRRTVTDPDPEDEALHELRKLLKDMMYIASFCEHHWPKGFQRLERFPLADLKPLSAMAGDYNDHTNRISFLYSFASVFPSAAVTTVFTEQLRTAIGQRQQLKTALLAAMQQFVAKLPRR